MDKRDSQIISLLRFPLCVMVVFVHYSSQPFANGGDWFRVLFSNVLSAPALPLFFIMSGYLFFRGLEQWDWNVWKGKMKRRVKTLLIPYLIWITLFIVYVYLHQCRLSVGAGEGWLPLGQWFANNGGIRMWWDSGVSVKLHPLGYKMVSVGPFHPVMWFIRDLMVVNLLSPLIHFLLRKAGYAVLSVLLVLYLLCLWLPIHSIGITCLFCYSAGAFFSIRGKGFLECFSKLRIPALILAAAMIVPMVAYRQTDFYTCTKPLWRLITAICTVNLIALIHQTADNAKIKFLGESSFLVFALHYFLISNVRQAFLVLPPLHIPEMCLFLLTVLVTIASCLLVYWLLRKFFPKLCVLLCGR